jgi:hypothetical protein
VLQLWRVREPHRRQVFDGAAAKAVPPLQERRPPDRRLSDARQEGQRRRRLAQLGQQERRPSVAGHGVGGRRWEGVGAATKPRPPRAQSASLSAAATRGTPATRVPPHAAQSQRPPGLWRTPEAGDGRRPQAVTANPKGVEDFKIINRESKKIVCIKIHAKSRNKKKKPRNQRRSRNSSKFTGGRASAPPATFGVDYKISFGVETHFLEFDTIWVRNILMRAAIHQSEITSKKLHIFEAG